MDEAQRIEDLETAIEGALVGLQTLALTDQLHGRSTAIAGVVRLLSETLAKGQR
jgi:hypothetical protein